jgi:nucleotide-binding universal stress UspA family protein
VAIATSPFQRILFTTDFSPYSASAAPFVRFLAEHYRTELFLAYVISADSEALEPDAPPKIARSPDALPEQQMRAFIAANSLDRLVTQALVESGAIGDVIERIVRDKAIDLIVLGTHGRSGVGKLILGSVAERIFQMAPCPVLSVGRKARKSWDKGSEPNLILYASDFDPASLRALPYALSLARVANGQLILLHVPEASLAGRDPSGIHERLNSLIPAEARNWCRFDTLAIFGDPADVILQSASDRNADLIVMGGHRVTGPLYPLQVPRTTAYRVISQAHCPVLRITELAPESQPI